MYTIEVHSTTTKGKIHFSLYMGADEEGYQDVIIAV